MFVVQRLISVRLVSLAYSVIVNAIFQLHVQARCFVAGMEESLRKEIQKEKSRRRREP